MTGHNTTGADDGADDGTDAPPSEQATAIAGLTAMAAGVTAAIAFAPDPVTVAQMAPPLLGGIGVGLLVAALVSQHARDGAFGGGAP